MVHPTVEHDPDAVIAVLVLKRRQMEERVAGALPPQSDSGSTGAAGWPLPPPPTLRDLGRSIQVPARQQDA